MEEDILNFLKGNDKILKDKIMEKIVMFSNNLNFEAALELKKELEYISVILDKQRVELNDFKTRDVIGFHYDEGLVSVQILFLRNGKIVGGNNDKFYLISDVFDEVNSYILSFYNKHEIPKEILVQDGLNASILSNITGSNVLVPQKGAKRKLVEMATVNSKISLEQEVSIIRQDEKRSVLANDELRKILNLPVLDRIDSFDNSNLFGSYAVSGMIVFKNGRPAKNEYRKYKVTVDKNDDYNTMKEVIYRRYFRALVDKTEMPDLILVDGGENQIRATLDVLNDLNLHIRVCGLKKDDHHRTNQLIDENLDLIEIPRSSDVFHYLTRIQDEVHRFTITYHKTLRDKGSISSVLDQVEGIGKVRKKELIKKFGSVKKMALASVDELSDILPRDVAVRLKEYLEEREKK